MKPEYAQAVFSCQVFSITKLQSGKRDGDAYYIWYVSWTDRRKMWCPVIAIHS